MSNCSWGPNKLLPSVWNPTQSHNHHGASTNPHTKHTTKKHCSQWHNHIHRTQLENNQDSLNTHSGFIGPWCMSLTTTMDHERVPNQFGVMKVSKSCHCVEVEEWSVESVRLFHLHNCWWVVCMWAETAWLTRTWIASCLQYWGLLLARRTEGSGFGLGKGGAYLCKR